MKNTINITCDNLYSIIRESVKRALLTEENSINKDVELEAEYIANIISRHKYTEDEIVEKNDKYTHYEISLNHSFLGCTVNYNINYFEFSDGIHRKLDCYSTPISKKNASVHINYDLEGGRLVYGDLYDSLQHELTHVLKNKIPLEMDRNYVPRAYPLFNAANFFFNSNEPMKRKIGLIFYLGLNDEQDAFINGLYASIKQNLKEGILPNETIRKSQLMSFTKELIDIKNNINNFINNEDFINALKEFKQYSKYKGSLGKNAIIRKIDYTLIRVNKKFCNMAKALKKYILNSGLPIRGDMNTFIVNTLL